MTFVWEHNPVTVIESIDDDVDCDIILSVVGIALTWTLIFIADKRRRRQRRSSASILGIVITYKHHYTVPSVFRTYRTVHPHSTPHGTGTLHMCCKRDWDCQLIICMFVIKLFFRFSWLFEIERSNRWINTTFVFLSLYNKTVKIKMLEPEFSRSFSLASSLCGESTLRRSARL